MAINLGQSDLDPTQMWFGNNSLKEVWVGDEKVWPSLPPLARSEPDYWFSLEDGLHDYNRGTKSTPLTYNSAGRFVNRGDHVYVNGAEARINTTEPWSGEFTVAAWFENTGASSETEYLWARGNASTGNAIYVMSPNSDKSKIGVRIDDGVTLSSWVYTEANTLPGPGEGWFHFAYTSEINPEGRNLHRIYINGVYVQGWLFSATYGVLTFGPTEWTSIGNVSTDSLYPYEGNLDDIAIWSRTLSVSEIKEIVEAGRSTPPIIPTITTLVLPDMRQGVAFSTQLAANFTVTSWTAVGVPPGLTLNSTTGVLSGTPSTITSGTMTVVANGANDQTAEMTYSWMVEANLVNLSVGFVNDAELFENFPLRGFDGRTSSSSPRNPGWTWNGMLVTGDNNYATYWNVLHDRPIKGDAEWVLRTGDAVSSSNPLGLVLSSSSSFTNQIILEITNDNLRLVRRTTGGITSIKSYNTADAGPWSDVRVVRSGTDVSVYASGSLKFTQSLASYDYWNLSNNGYFGISMYSTSGQWCGRVDSFVVNQTS